METALDDPDGGPFFAEICYGLPHPPLVAPQHYLDLYSPDEVPIPESVPTEASLSPNRLKALARYHGSEDTEDLDFRDLVRAFIARYYGLVACVDHNVGRILDWLDKREIAGNTVVLLVSDHGELAGEHGRFEKKTYYRNSMNAALIIRYPERFAGGRVVDALVDPAVDTMPMLLDLCGIETPDCVQGTSYLPLLDGTSAATRDTVYYEVLGEREGPESFPVAERGLRTKRWVYVRTADGPKVLFDLEEDPLEMSSVVNSPAYAQVIEELDARVLEHMERTGDSWEIEAHFPPPDFQTHAEGDECRRQLLKRAIVEP